MAGPGQHKSITQLGKEHKPVRKKPSVNHVELHEKIFVKLSSDKTKVIIKNQKGEYIFAVKGRKRNINGVTAHTIKILRARGKPIEAYIFKDRNGNFHLAKYTLAKKKAGGKKGGKGKYDYDHKIPGQKGRLRVQGDKVDIDREPTNYTVKYKGKSKLTIKK